MLQQNNIKLITHLNFPYGGASANYLRNFAFSLSEAEYEVEVLLPTGHIYGNTKAEAPQRHNQIKNITYTYLGFRVHPKSIIGKIISLIWAFFYPPIHLIYAQFKSKFKIIIAYNTHITRIASLLLYKFLFRKKMILILPEFYEKPKFNILLKLEWYNFYFGLKYFAKYADGYIVFSKMMEQYLMHDLKIKKPILIIPNITDPKDFELEHTKPFLEDAITIGYAGTPTRKDGIDDLIESFARLSHRSKQKLHLLIIGDTTGHYSVIPSLKEKVKALEIGHAVTFTGLVSFTEIPTLLNSCQILALTRPKGVFAEAGFPTKLGEYMACRKPILATDVGDIPMYFESEKQVYIAQAENLESIVSGFEYIIENPREVEQMSIEAHRWMMENLDYRCVAGKLKAFLLKF